VQILACRAAGNRLEGMLDHGTGTASD